ncbi:glycosyltransferase family 8 protein [Apodospora peruviana]|uniref:Glycosyltransferase family 8 protein n=1 Tax=Apodospora peruviana TaxID=516989 RepID=A0AAE0IJA9_9PEZI|nr:glycosyltransferase family 8 protein [Apodospora peruviana]
MSMDLESTALQNPLVFTQVAWASQRVKLAVISTTVFFFLLTLVHHHDGLTSVSTRWRARPGDANDEQFTPSVDYIPKDDVDWSRFAYTQYVTNSEYLCNSVMLFETLHRLGSRANRVIMYPSTMLDDQAGPAEGKGDNARLLAKARDEYKVHLVPIVVQSRPNMNDRTWAESFTKLLAWNNTEYDRVIHLDSDATVLQPMDELFLLPACAVAMPRAYWLYPKKKILASTLMVLQPSAVELARITDAISHAGAGDYDMEIVNKLYGDSALVLPHRRYGLLTSEFRRDRHDHVKYLGTDQEKWDPVAAYNEAKFVHFSDWPVPKPWRGPSGEVMKSREPKCHEVPVAGKDGTYSLEESCAERDIWYGLYEDFARRRERVCEGGIEAQKSNRKWRM